MQTNIFAFTQFNYASYPGYVSLNETDGVASLTVRSPEHGGMLSGSCPLSDEKLAELAENILRYLASK